MTETARTRAARIVVDEHDVLLRMLEEQRRAVRNAVHGLSEDQARSTPSASQLSLAAVIKHLTQGERTWTVVRMAGRDTETDPQGEWMAGFQVDSEGELATLRQEVAAADIAADDEPGANCCYALSDKYWVQDPQGIAWETFHTLGDIPTFGSDRLAVAGKSAAACCAPATGSAAPAPSAKCCS